MSLISILKKKNNKTLFTTPSHSGNLCIFHKFYQWYRKDISETDAYNPQEALIQAQERAAGMYGVKKTRFLSNGSTSGIIAAVLSCVNKGEKLLIWSKSHPCHKNAGILAGAEIVEYELPYNEEWGIYEKLLPENLRQLIQKVKPKAVIVTTPSYEGIASDVKEISRICKNSGVILIADEAHGALYPFSEDLPQSAVTFADFTIQSLHKTAGGINPTALLHTNTDFEIDKALSLISTTSPSYPMLATIEANINFLFSKRGKKKLNQLLYELKLLRKKLINFEFYGDDITKILIKKKGYTGFELSEILYTKFGVEDERTNEKSTMLLTGLGTDCAKLKKLEKLIKL